jgi:DUF2892 family protein
MCNDLVIRRFAGVFVLLSIAAGYWLSPLWFLFTAFVGVNLLQSSFTDYCPLERMLGWAGLAGCRPRRVDSTIDRA